MWPTRRHRPRIKSAKSDINVTPLIDVLLVLLVIFMVITPLTPRGFTTTVPQEPPPGLDNRSEPEKVLVLSMDRNGIIHINQDEVQLNDLSSQLQGIFKTRRDHTLFVQGDSSLLFNDVAHIIDVAKVRARIGLGL
jgi:biopolymer transport protein ExbD